MRWNSCRISRALRPRSNSPFTRRVFHISRVSGTWRVASDCRWASVTSPNLDMNQHPRFFTVRPPDAEQLVGEARPEFTLSSNLLQFFIERFVASAPIDARLDFRKKETQE